ncbi:MAG: hypothetical protein J6W37_09250 [Bacteroidales bacterium]|nr:hypothetical protein [Bacteroidales bacterium]
MKLLRSILPFLLLSFVAQAQSPVKDGAILAEFSVSDSTKVYFSQGNLQYQASTNTWRFAEHQWNYVGKDNENISKKYKGWIDLFGWGTSGYNSKNPYETILNFSDYGDGENDIAGTNYDWGVYNKISNGGNQAGLWRTLTIYEWYYLINTRVNASNKNGIATVNGVSGLILLPDTWTLLDGMTFTSGTNGDFALNTYSASDWSKMEMNGAVFLPAAGSRYETDIRGVGSFGTFWSSSAYDGGSAVCLHFDSVFVYADHMCRCSGRSVRLVQDVRK